MIESSAPKMLMSAPESALKFGPRKLMFDAWSPPDPAPNKIRLELVKSKVNRPGLTKLIVLPLATIDLRLVGPPPLGSKMLRVAPALSSIVPPDAGSGSLLASTVMFPFTESILMTFAEIVPLPCRKSPFENVLKLPVEISPFTWIEPSELS